MLAVTNLTASLRDDNDKPVSILRGINLNVPSGQVHAIMGPNGSGKSTLAGVLAGRDEYTLTGQVLFDGVDLLSLNVEQRAAAGVFLAFQYPVEIPGVNNMYFLRTAVNTTRIARGESEISATEFLALAKKAAVSLGMNPSFLFRSVNDGFSGGEKKRNEVLQMLLLNPTFVVLDETDSGLDIDALRVVAKGVQRWRNSQRSLLVITHYPRLLEYVRPDVIHVLQDGRITRQGGFELARELEESGYGFDSASSLDDSSRPVSQVSSPLARSLL